MVEKRGKEFRGHFSARENFSPFRVGVRVQKRPLVHTESASRVSHVQNPALVHTGRVNLCGLCAKWAVFAHERKVDMTKCQLRGIGTTFVIPIAVIPGVAARAEAGVLNEEIKIGDKYYG